MHALRASEQSLNKYLPTHPLKFEAFFILCDLENNVLKLSKKLSFFLY